jgi:uncharacterized integral membrane protein
MRLQKFVWWATALVALLLTTLAFVNWRALIAPTAVHFLTTSFEAPLSLLVLVLVGILILVFGVAVLGRHIASLLETRQLLKVLQRLQALAGTADASRMEALRRTMSMEFRMVNGRIFQALGTGPGNGFDTGDSVKLPLIKLSQP